MSGSEHNFTFVVYDSDRLTIKRCVNCGTLQHRKNVGPHHIWYYNPRTEVTTFTNEGCHGSPLIELASRYLEAKEEVN